MKYLHYYLLLIISIIFAMNSQTTYSQTRIIKQGTMFVQVKSKTSRAKEPLIKTAYTFKASDGNIYPVYISSKGKVFIVKRSNKTGKLYKQYLPELTSQLNQKPD